MESMRWLTLRLGHNQSIGPRQLQDLWAAACETNHSSVTREALDGKPVAYALHAPVSLGSPKRAELRMRRLLEDAGYRFTLGTLDDRPPATPIQRR